MQDGSEGSLSAEIAHCAKGTQEGFDGGSFGIPDQDLKYCVVVPCDGEAF